jgi:hypothetical protein
MTKLELYNGVFGSAPEGFSLVDKVIDDTRMCFFYRKDDTLLIAFGPTKGNLYFDDPDFKTWLKNGTDWLRNFSFWKKTFSIGSKKYKAHSGFVTEYLSLREEILKQINIFQPKEILISGFSQGGAHTTICFRDLIENFKSIKISGFAFAAPRAYGLAAMLEFNRALKARPECNFLRISAYGDPMWRLAPWVFNYFGVAKNEMIGPKRNELNADKWHQPSNYREFLN